MNNDAQKNGFSLKVVIFTAFISFLITGVGGTLLNAYVDRPKPSLVVSAAGFEGGTDLISIPQALIDASFVDDWGRSFKNFETFQSLWDRDILSSESEQRIKAGLQAAEEWLAQYADVQPIIFSKQQLEAHPLFTHEVVISTFNGAIRRSELITPPHNDLNSHKPIYPIYRHSDGPLLHMGARAIPFPDEGFVDKEQEIKNLHLAKSFSVGHKLNVVNYTNQFIEASRKSLIAIAEVRSALHKVLLENARASVDVTILNSGNSAITLKPYFVLGLKNSDNKFETYVMSAKESKNESNDRSPLLSLLSDEHDISTGKKFSPEEFLPKAGGLRYITITAGQTINLKLVATTTLENPTQFKTMYESGLLPIRVIAYPVEGKPFYSAQSIFGKDISDKQRKEIEKSATEVLANK